MLSLRQTLALSLVTLGAIALSVSATASCSNYSEGDRCDVNNGISGSDSDCNDNLVCTPASALGSESDICCPQDRSQATVAPCVISTSPVADSAAPPASDTGANDTGASDTGAGDASSE